MQESCFNVSEMSHVGRVRKLNEDAILSRPTMGVWAVADGMGGHQGGDFAARTVIDAIAAVDPELPSGDLMKAIRGAIQEAHAEIAAEGLRRGGVTIGSTVAALILANGHFACLWAGDSRIYHARDQAVTQLSRDHSLVNDLIEAGQIAPEDAELHPQANVITRAVGVGPELVIDKVRGAYAPGDRFLICSDGLTGAMRLSDIEHHLAEDAVEGMAERLVDGALAGGGHDNISVIVVEPTDTPAESLQV